VSTDIKHIKNISVIGAGLMGHGIAQIFAVKGYGVALVDTRQEILSEAIKNIRSNLTLMAQRGIGHPGHIEPAIKRVTTTVELRDAASRAQFVVEAVSEDLRLKQDIFQELDSICPQETILATNTSVMSVSEIAAKAKIRERIIGTHFWNPPYLIPLVEVVKGQETASWSMDTTFRLLKHVGKHPVRVDRDVPGFIGNRLHHALWREAISIVENGIAEPAMVDEVIKYGFGMRLPALGPLENADMIGLDLTLAIHDYILKHIERSPHPSVLLRQRVNEGKLGFKTGEGFQKWTPDQAERSRRNLLEYLLKYVKEHEGEFG
jgi:3-hydroxybutyryl-CoA dehydrogenase